MQQSMLNALEGKSGLDGQSRLGTPFPSLSFSQSTSRDTLLRSRSRHLSTRAGLGFQLAKARADFLECIATGCCAGLLNGRP